MDGEVHVVVYVVARRVVAFPVAFGVLAIDFGAGLANLRIAPGDLGEVHHVRVRIAPPRRGGDDEALRVLVEEHLGVATERARRVEPRDAVLVRLAVIELLADLFDRRAPALAEEGGELLGALFAQVAVFKLPVAEQADLPSADIAALLLEDLSKQSHTRTPSRASNEVFVGFMVRERGRRGNDPMARSAAQSATAWPFHAEREGYDLARLLLIAHFRDDEPA